MAVTVAVEPEPILTLDLTSEEAGRIAEAQRQGVDLAAMLRGVITRLPAEVGRGANGADAAAGRPAVPIALDELEAMEAAVQRDFDNSGLSEDDLGDFVNDLVHRVRTEMNAEANAEANAEGSRGTSRADVAAGKR